MAETPTPETLDTAEARRLINVWCGNGFFRVKRLGDRLELEDVRAHYSYALRLQSQLEDRIVSRQQVPYHGGPVDDRGHAPRPWDIAVKQPTDFENRTETLTVPHTERVETCGQCEGAGMVRCEPCQGFGRVNCPHCQGRGFTERTLLPGQPDQYGQTSTEQRIVQMHCTTCYAGKVDCGTCNGHGKHNCPTCTGSGRVKTFDQLTVQFQAPVQNDVVDKTELPDELVGKVKGDVVLNERGPYLDRLPTVVPEVDFRVQKLLEQSRPTDAEKSRLHFQQIQVERVVVHEILYRHRGSGVKRLWFYGQEMQVHAPGVPRPWFKLLGIMFGIPLGLAALLGLAAMLFK